MWVFLQNWRTTLIPAIAVPVVLFGTFGALAVFGYTINTLTLFALVLSIGLLVDDAIVVIENVERIMREEQTVAARRHAQVDAADHRRADRHRAGAVGGVRADGVLRRIDRRDLPPVLGDDRLGDGAVDLRRAGADAGAVRDAAEAGAARAVGTPRLVLHEVQLDVRERSRALRARAGTNTRPTRADRWCCTASSSR